MPDDLPPHISHVQFAEAVRANGGESRRLSNGKPPPKRGYMRGTGTHEQELDRPLSAESAEEHWNAARAAVTNPEAYQGAWEEPGKATTTAEVAVRDPDRATAVRLGRQEPRQVAVYNLRTGRDVNLSDTKPGDRVVGDANGLRDVTHRGSPERAWDVIHTPVLGPKRPKSSARTVFSGRATR